MTEKLFLTSLLVFLPFNAQMPVGLVAVGVYIAILEIKVQSLPPLPFLLAPRD